MHIYTKTKTITYTPAAIVTVTNTVAGTATVTTTINTTITTTNITRLYILLHNCYFNHY